ncbi:hypothetical protein GCM10022286_06900 [Gryllotalpicola daejeonensis]|uniref:DUF4279 domain-containing protein n=1 Tax=Gryllotalpicola daejeonensis TaxID=993087 RepID=A0ABP7ZFV2_9MICO
MAFDRDKNYACLSVSLEDPAISVEEIVRVLQRTPDETRRLGEQSTPNGPASKWNSVSYFLGNSDEQPLNLQLGEAVMKLGNELADRLSLLAQRGASVSVQYVQSVHGDADTAAKGIWLESGAIAWLARAQASLDIDQYFYADESTTDRFESSPSQTAPLLK